MTYASLELQALLARDFASRSPWPQHPYITGRTLFKLAERYESRIRDIAQTRDMLFWLDRVLDHAR